MMIDQFDIPDLVDPFYLDDLVDPFDLDDLVDPFDLDDLVDFDDFERDPTSTDPARSRSRSGSYVAGGMKEVFPFTSRDTSPTFEQWSRLQVLPPSAEVWSRLPWVIRLYVFLVILAYTWEDWLVEIGLRLGGAW